MVLSKDMHWAHAKIAGFWTEDDRDWPTDENEHLRTKEMKLARSKSKGFFFGLPIMAQIKQIEFREHLTA